ncbi:TIGR04255 family protein [Streptomyces sp. NBC_00663]|uniref:TIGR04255 family protein n=1 Tax=Streptomyces sp. NBC_00663 TaxID=2975801 RepID=UPI002E34594B|nr:TIGR04255 family protein [Streptomyces sp. NBC_00663]
MRELPDFARPPVVEVACGLQFRRITGIHGLKLTPLYETWRAELPNVEEHPPLPGMEPNVGPGPKIKLDLASLPAARYWFLDDSGRDLVQLQQDRLIVNWRDVGDGTPYPRFGYVLSKLKKRLDELANFVDRAFGAKLEVIHAELSYVNALAGESGDPLDPHDVFHTWPDFALHHLGKPVNSQIVFDFPIEEFQSGRNFFLRAAIESGSLLTGQAGNFLTMTVQGRPGSTGSSGAVAAIEEAHEHLVASFAEITTDSAHKRWGKRS